MSSTTDEQGNFLESGRSAASTSAARPIQRIAITGCSGSGKSTLARALGQALGLPVFHLDQLYFLPGWVAPADETAFHDRICAIQASERWIIDGGYSPTMEARFRAADLVVLFDRPTVVCLLRAVKRVATTYGRVRPDMAPGCPERFDLEFLRYIASYPRTKWPKIKAYAESFAPDKTAFLRTDRDMADLIARFRG